MMELMTTTEMLTGIKNWVLGKLQNIWALIPSQASSSNQLADKAFVNSSIATATATFRGTYNVVSDLLLSYNATHAQIEVALATKITALSITPDTNDYAFVQIPAADATPTVIARVDRYKFNGTAWAYEYSLNNSGFTAEQWAAINSGATLELIGKLSALPTNAQLTELLNGKVSLVDNGAYDVSANNGGITFASLSALLSSQNLSTLIPTAVRQPGMSIKFKQGTSQSSDNKYVQFRYMSSSTAAADFTNTANWQGEDYMYNNIFPYFAGSISYDFVQNEIKYSNGNLITASGVKTVLATTITIPTSYNLYYVILDSNGLSTVASTDLPISLKNKTIVGVIDRVNNVYYTNAYFVQNLNHTATYRDDKTAIISGKVLFTFGDSSWTLAYSNCYAATVNGTTLVAISNVNLEINDLNAHYLYYKSTSGNRKLVAFRYDQRPSASEMEDYYYVGMVFPNAKRVLANIREISIDGDDVVNFFASDKSTLQQSAKKLPILTDAVFDSVVLPNSTWKDKNYNSPAGTDAIFFDKRNIISSNNKLAKIGVKATNSGTVKIHYLSTTYPYAEIANETHSVSSGINEFLPTTELDYTQNMYVGFSNVANSNPGVRLIYPTDNTGQSVKKFIADGSVVEQTYPYALWIYTLEDKVSKLGNIDTLAELKYALSSNAPLIELAGVSFNLDETLSIPSGTKIVGVRGKTIINVPSTVLKGIELRNKEDIVIENITLVGAYNGTPLKSGLQPVKAGIVDTADDARAFVNANYQTDTTNGGVTSESIPQIGINIYACEKIEIIGCEIKNFSNCGICNGYSGRNYRYACKFENNYINNCYCGIKTYNEAERSQYIANNISLCQIGLYTDSGTNMFAYNAYSANRIGMLMNNGWNQSHDVHTGNAYTHCSLFSILAFDIENGAVFSQCKIGYNDNEVGNHTGAYGTWFKNSRGLVFENCQLITAEVRIDGKFVLHGQSYTLGSADVFGNTPYVVTYEDLSENPPGNGGITRFMNCSALNSAAITKSSDLDNTNVILKNNYYISGADSSGLNN